MQANDLQAYMGQVEQSIGGAFYADKLAVHLAGAVQGPHTLTFGIKLYQPTKANVAKALALAPSIEATTGISPVRVYVDHGFVLVEVPSPAPVVIYGRSLKGQGLAVPIGMGSRRGIVGVDFEKSPHALFVGPTNAGKTTASRSIAYQLARQNSPRNVRFIFSTFKPKDWKAFSNVAHCMAVVSDPAESATMIAWLTKLMYERVKQEVDRPHIFCFVDDLLNLLGATNGEVAKDLRELASLGRGCGIHLLIGTQRLGEMGAGGAGITGNIRTRLVFGTADAQDAAHFTGRGESGAETLGKYPGDCLLVNNGSTQRLAVALVTDQDVTKLPQSDISARPWQQKMQWNGGNGTDSGRSTIVPIDRSTTFTPENWQNEGRNVPPKEGGETGLEVENTPFAPRNVPQPTRLPDAPPSADEQQYLRELYVRLGSKRAVLKAAWGGVVNDDGKTPKTQRWLDEALEE